MVNVIVNAIIKFSKMSLVGFMLFLLLISSPSNTSYQDPELQPFVEEFIKIGKLFKVKDIESKTKQLSIRFGSISDRELANCRYFYQQVTVNSKFWHKLSIENKEELIFHELGHCILKKTNHSDTGIMKAAGLHHPLFYKENYEYLINSLFDTKEYVTIKWDKNKYQSSKELKLTKADLLNNKHAVVRFTATWCPPCKALAPVFNEVAAEHPDVVVYVVDVDENSDLANEMNIRGIPCLVDIRDKKINNTLVGNQPKPEIEKLFK